MRFALLLRLLLIISCICLSFYLIFIDDSINKSISIKNTAFYKLRLEHGMDTAESRKRFIQKRAEISQEIDQLSKQRHPHWYGYIVVILGLFTGWLIRRTIILFKKGSD